MFLISMVIFQLGNSSNAFIILKARETGLSVTLIPLIWMVYNGVCTGSSPLFGLAGEVWMMWALFAAYGVYYGLSEGIFRAYIADLVGPEHRGSAYGMFNTGIGLALFPASLIMGALWDRYGSKTAFLAAAALSLLGFLSFVASLPLPLQRRWKPCSRSWPCSGERSHA